LLVGIRFEWGKRSGKAESEQVDDAACPDVAGRLVLDGAVVAVVERKTFDGLLAEFGRMRKWRDAR